VNIYYISPSVIPSRSANSIHVISMCEALNQLGHRVFLFASSEGLIKNKRLISDFYGIKSDNITLHLNPTKFKKGIELSIAIYAFYKFIFDKSKNNVPKIIFSRNLYAAVVFGFLFKKNVIYETHSPEYGFRKRLQKWALNSSKIQTVVISKALKEIICKFHNHRINNVHIFHDASREYELPLSEIKRAKQRNQKLSHNINLKEYDKFIGYFGHLYAGRGIEVILGLALKNSKYAFLVYGGNDKEINQYRNDNKINNLFFLGHIPPNDVHSAMSMMDILLMPYQNSVSVGISGIDTSRWMSPMKMFEYMSCGIPIISSDLPVLKEVLRDGFNSLLVKPNDINDWSDALQRISYSPDLSAKLGENAYRDYKEKYTWKIRAKSILELHNDFK
jgi:glycosyltransferase involved in cell wall biosynthesis